MGSFWVKYPTYCLTWINIHLSLHKYYWRLTERSRNPEANGLTLSNHKNNPNSLRLALNLATAIFSLGLVFSLFVWRSGLASRDLYGNSFHVLYVRNEPVVFLLLFLALWLVRPYLFGDRFLAAWPSPPSSERVAKFPWLWLIVPTVVLIAWLGDYLVLHGFPLSNDEFLPRFQAQIFAAGQIKAILPPELREFGKALTPIFAVFDPSKGHLDQYLPTDSCCIADRVPGPGSGVLDRAGPGGVEPGADCRRGPPALALKSPWRHLLRSSSWPPPPSFSSPP